MDITMKNFKEMLPKVKEAIDKADFLSFDLELTGLHWDKEAQPTIMDDLSNRYQKLRETAMNFAITQFGLCCFCGNANNTSYCANPFNFYIFSRPSRLGGVDRRFICQSSSIDFLCKSGFDFNKLFCEGIPYLNMNEEADIKAKMKISEDRQEIAITESCQAFIDDTMTKISNWLQSSTERAMVLPPCNSLFRRLVYQEVGKKYGDALYLESKGVKENSTMKSIEICKMTNEERQQLMEEKQFNKQTELEAAIGFRHVIDAICDSKKLVIGHNMLLDLCFLMAQLIGNMPESLPEFKIELLNYLPRILDTKHLATANSLLQTAIPSTNLEDMANTLKGSAFDVPQIAFDMDSASYKPDTELFHQAGYDAYQTGYAFLKMAYYLRSQNVLSFDENQGVLSSPELKEYINKLYIMRNTLPVMKLDGEDPPPDCKNVFFLYNFPKEWKYSHILNVFKNIETLNIKWVGETEVRVVVGQESTQDVLEAIEYNEARKDKQYSICTNEQYRAKQELHDFVARDLKKRRISINRQETTNEVD